MENSAKLRRTTKTVKLLVVSLLLATHSSKTVVMLS